MIPFGDKIEIRGNIFADYEGDGNRDNHYNNLRNFNWNHHNYEHAVEANLRKIARFHSGRIILESLKNKTIIIPVGLWRGTATGATRSVRVDALTGPAFPISRSNAHKMFLNDNRSANIFNGSAGSGNITQIMFTPSLFVPGTTLFNRSRPQLSTFNLIDSNNQMRMKPDEFLLHELVHAVRQTSGLCCTRNYNGAPMGSHQDFEEFVAVLISNIYRSEKGRNNALRWGYQNPTGGSGYTVLNNYRAFYSNTSVFLEIQLMFRHMNDLCQQLARIPCDFNPLREYVRDALGLRPSSLSSFKGYFS